MRYPNPRPRDDRPRSVDDVSSLVCEADVVDGFCLDALVGVVFFEEELRRDEIGCEKRRERPVKVSQNACRRTNQGRLTGPRSGRYMMQFY